MGIRKDPIELACCDKSADARGKGKSASRCRTIFGAIIALPVLAGDDSSFAAVYWEGTKCRDKIGMADDTPMFGELLGFEFPFLSRARRVSFTNVNGAVTFEPRPPCGRDFGSPTCTINTSWYDLVAVAVTNLDPSRSPYSQIWTGGNATSWAVRYENVSVYDKSPSVLGPRLTAGVRLHADGRLEIFHELVDEQLARRHDLLVGLRLERPSGNESSKVALTPAQRERMHSWGTSIEGVYAGSSPRNRSRIVMCPVPEMWCLAAANRTTLDVVAPFFGCGSELDAFGFRCAIISADDKLIARSSKAELLPDGAVGLRCIFSDNISSLAGRIEIRYDAALGDDDDGAGDGGLATETYLERKLVVVGDNAGATCGAESRMNKTGCNLFGPFFSRADCSGCPACPREGDSTASSNVFDDNGEVTTASFVDEEGVCCDWRVIDCLGVCGGRAEVSVDNERPHTLVCKPCDTIDCNGECGGKAVVDDCGVCGGQDRSKDSCGVCGGGATSAEACPKQATQERSGEGHDDDTGTKVRGRSSHSTGSIFRSIHEYPWIVSIIVLEIVVSIACFRSCTARRAMRYQFERHQHRDDQAAAEGDGWPSAESTPRRESPSPTLLLARRDLDDLVETSMSPRDTYFVEHGVSAGARLNAFALSLDPSRRLFARPTTLGDTIREMRVRVAEAYQLAVAALCATPVADSSRSRALSNEDVKAAAANNDGGDIASNSSEPPICAICLDHLHTPTKRCVRLPVCHHEFHRECVHLWLSAHNSCPCCKRRAVERVEPAPCPPR